MALSKKLLTSDLINFIKSIGFVFKYLVDEYGYDEKLIPNFIYQQNKENKKDNFRTKEYEKPLIYINLLKRTNMSLDSNRMFEEPRPLRPIFKTKEIDGVQINFIKKDNKIQLRVYTKTISEKLTLQDLLEHIIDEFSGKLKSDICVLDEIKDVFEDEFAVNNDFYVFDFIINVRTTKQVKLTDTSILNKIFVNFEQKTCKHFNGNNCTKIDAEKADTCNLDTAKNILFCDDFEL